MSFSELAQQGPPPPTQGLPCAIAVLLDKLDKPEREGLATILADRDWSHSRVFKAIEDEGHKVPRQTLERHRRNECRCAVRKS